MSDTAKLEVLSETLKRFMDSQDKHNESVALNLKELSKAQAILLAQQVEINNLSTRVKDLDHKHDIYGKRIGDLESNQAVATHFRKDITQMKYLTYAGFITIVGIVLTWALTK